MNPDSTSNLPSPVAEPRPTQQAVPVPVPPPLTVPMAPATPVAPVAQTPLSPAAPAPTGPQSLQQLQSGATDALLPSPTMVADEDNLVLDHEWIMKAKQAVAETATDPYEQNRRLAEIKADYLQKRYAKTIKLAE